MPTNIKFYKTMKKILFHTIFAASCLLTAASCTERQYSLEIFSTNDLHGAVFTNDYSGGENRSSLSRIHRYVDSVRSAAGEDNVILFDCGDHLQGDNATYYFNYCDTSGNPHIMSRIFGYMGYDAVAVGNHDIEAGPSVYDKIRNEMGIPYLAANAVDLPDNQPHFQEWTLIERNGLKIAVLGFTNPNVKSWVSPDKYEGMDFIKIEDMAQEAIDKIRKKSKPDLFFIISHSGLGNGETPDIENNSLYLASHLKGIDAIFAAHDHRIYAGKLFNGEDSVSVLEASSKAKALGNLSITVKKKGNRIVSKEVNERIIPMENKADSPEYNSAFKSDYETVNRFSNRVIGRLAAPIDLSYRRNEPGDYMSFIHFVQLSQPDVDISITAPLVEKGMMEAGDILFNDLFTLYRFENLLYVVKMSGREVKDFLEEAYELRISGKGPKYNYDCAGGINYTVKESAPKGERVMISSFADGRPFDQEASYNVAMTSYRASGAGGLLKAAGIESGEMQNRIMAIHPEIRMLICDYIEKAGTVYPDEFSNKKITGTWRFVK